MKHYRTKPSVTAAATTNWDEYDHKNVHCTEWARARHAAEYLTGQLDKSRADVMHAYRMLQLIWVSKKLPSLNQSQSSYKTYC